MANHVNFGRVARPESSKGVGSPAHPQRSFSKAAFVRALQRLLPDTRAEHLHPAPSGVRTQALGRDGKLVDDFEIVENDLVVHVLNAPSPAATAALNVGRLIVDKLVARLS